MTDQEKDKLYLKIDELINWYWAQSGGAIRLFKGEENEMTLDNIYAKTNHYDQLRRNLKYSDYLRPEHITQIHRAYYYNVECWPLERIQARFSLVS